MNENRKFILLVILIVTVFLGERFYNNFKRNQKMKPKSSISKTIEVSEKKEVGKVNKEKTEDVISTSNNEEVTSVEGTKNFKIIMQNFTYEEKGQLLDVNTATANDMLTKKISMSHIKKIIDYRDRTGGFRDLEEIVRISGIGKKTYEKLAKVLEVGSEAEKKPLNINNATDEDLLYYGFTKKELGKLKEYKKKHDYIFDNIALMDIIGEKRVRDFKNDLTY